MSPPPKTLEPIDPEDSHPSGHLNRNRFYCMKKLIQAASLVSAGAAVLTCSQVLAAEGGSKPWSLSLGLRGFYDDNIFTGNDQFANRPKEDAFGFEVTPGVQFYVPINDGQTTISGGYTYGFRYFADRPGRDYDQFHVANLGLIHRFSPRYELSIYNFTVAQEPELIASPAIVGGPVNQVVRAEGNNIRNTAGVDFTAQWSPQWSTVIGYQNNWYNYDFVGFANVLNRMEHLPSMRVSYHYSPRTAFGIGYQYGDLNYSRANYRDQRSHYIFAHADHSFTSQLLGSIRAGAQIVDWYNAPIGTRDNATNPYIDANLAYSYTTGSNFQLGVRHSRNATDVDDLAAVNNSVYDQQSTLVYASINHAFTGRLRGSIIGQYQNSEFIGVTANNPLDGQTEDFISFGVALNYKFTANIYGELAYYFDRLSSDVVFRDFDRNRIFVGVRATY